MQVSGRPDDRTTLAVDEAHIRRPHAGLIDAAIELVVGVQECQVRLQHHPPPLLASQLKRHNRLAIAVIVGSCTRTSPWRKPDLKAQVHLRPIEAVSQKRWRFKLGLDEFLLLRSQFVLHMPDVWPSLRLLRVVRIPFRSGPRAIVPHGPAVGFERANVEAFLAINHLHIMQSCVKPWHVINVLGLHVPKRKFLCKVLASPTIVGHPIAPIFNKQRISLPSVGGELVPSGVAKNHRQGESGKRVLLAAAPGREELL
mmetsp:Transcript_27236/g.78329  ORF Transcript_27236/g.78329 Transcript_27236/m.78329 type:complete len:256 (+) Transcript_27236:797-1564(+)